MPGNKNQLGGEQSPRAEALKGVVERVRASTADAMLAATALGQSDFARTIAERHLDEIQAELLGHDKTNTEANVRLYYSSSDPIDMFIKMGSTDEQEQERAEEALANIHQAFIDECHGYPGKFTYDLARDMSIRATAEGNRLHEVKVDPATDPHGKSEAQEITIPHPGIDGLYLVYAFPGQTPPGNSEGWPSLRLEPLEQDQPVATE